VLSHFIARRKNLQPVEKITISDMTTFVQRFGALESAVDTIAENFLDPKGNVHQWYHFDITQEVAAQKIRMLAKNSFAMIDYKTGANNQTYTGDFVLSLLRIGPGLKTVRIFKIFDKESGKVIYGLEPGNPFPVGGLLAYMKKRTEDRDPTISELSVIHHEGTKADSTAKGEDGAPTSTTTSPGDESKHTQPRSVVWEGYSPKGKDMTETDWGQWCKQRADLVEAYKRRYVKAIAIMGSRSLPKDADDRADGLTVTEYVDKHNLVPNKK